MKTTASPRAHIRAIKGKNVEKRIKEVSGGGGTPKHRVISKHAAPSIELYQMESCPDCHQVRARLTLLDLDYIAHTVSRSSDLKHKQLVDAGGKNQIPFLIDHSTGVKLYESDAICAYLENEYGDVPASWVLRKAKELQHRIEDRRERWSWLLIGPIEQLSHLRSDAAETLNSIKESWQAIREYLSEEAETSRSTRKSRDQAA